MTATALLLEIQERVNAKSTRTRRIRVSSESLTLGTTGQEDILLTALGGDFSVEIKYSENQWWIVNPHQSNQIRVNGRLVDLNCALEDESQILLHEHIVSVQLEKSQKEETKQNFSFRENFRSDEDLWNYLLEDPQFDEILINGPKQIYVDYQGKLLLSPWSFQSSDFLLQKIPGELKSGWRSWQINRSLRMQAALPPLVSEIHLSIRKARHHVFSLGELEERAFGSPEQIRILKNAVQKKESLIVSGGTSTGKTVLLRSLVEQVPQDQRLVIVEEEAETSWPHPHAIPIEAGRGQLELSVKECLRFRPDRLIVSEIRGAEAFDFLQAANTGHEGSMTTVHANSPREALHRIENLILSAGKSVHAESIRMQLSQAIQLVVQLKREADGTRKIDQIMRITGIQQGVILMGDPTQIESSGIQTTDLKRVR